MPPSDRPPLFFESAYVVSPASNAGLSRSLAISSNALSRIHADIGVACLALSNALLIFASFSCVHLL